MRSLALAATLIVAATVPVDAQVDYELDGSLWGRFESRSIDEGVNSNFTWLQTRIGAEMFFSPLVSVFAQVQDTRRMGEETSTGDGSAERLDMHQGYLDLGDRAETPVWVRIGRQEYEVSRGRLVGIPIWSPVSRIFDGVRAVVPVGDAATVELFGFQLAESTETVNPDDAYLLGGWGVVPLGDGDLHLIGLHDRDNADLQTTRTTLVAQYFGRTGPVTYRAEAGSQTGSVTDLDIVSGSLLTAFAALPWDDGRGSVGLGVERYGGNANPAAGESAGFSDLFGRNHRFLGFADIIRDPRADLGGRGLLLLNPQVTWRVRPDLQLRGDYHRFMLVDSDGYDGSAVADEIVLQLWGEIMDGLDIRAGGSWVGAHDPLVDFGLSAGDQLFGYVQLSAGFWGGGPGRTPRWH